MAAGRPGAHPPCVDGCLSIRAHRALGLLLLPAQVWLLALIEQVVAKPNLPEALRAVHEIGGTPILET